MYLLGKLAHVAGFAGQKPHQNVAVAGGDVAEPDLSSSARMKRLPDSRRRLAWEKIALYFMERLLVRYRIIVKGRRRRHG